MNTALANVLKGAAGVAVLFVLLTTVSRWWGDYRASDAPAGSSVATSTASPEGEGAKEPKTADPGDTEKAPEAKTVVVLTEGLNFRQEPSRDAKVIRGLAKGEKMTLVKTESGWHQVEDKEGTRGWISANTTYSEVQ